MNDSLSEQLLQVLRLLAEGDAEKARDLARAAAERANELDVPLVGSRIFAALTKFLEGEEEALLELVDWLECNAELADAVGDSLLYRSAHLHEWTFPCVWSWVNDEVLEHVLGPDPEDDEGVRDRMQYLLDTCVEVASLIEEDKLTAQNIDLPELHKGDALDAMSAITGRRERALNDALEAYPAVHMMAAHAATGRPWPAPRDLRVGSFAVGRDGELYARTERDALAASIESDKKLKVAEKRSYLEDLSELGRIVAEDRMTSLLQECVSEMKPCCISAEATPIRMMLVAPFDPVMALVGALVPFVFRFRPETLARCQAPANLQSELDFRLAETSEKPASCGSFMVARSRQRTFCSEKCRQTAYRLRRVEQDPSPLWGRAKRLAQRDWKSSGIAEHYPDEACEFDNLWEPASTRKTPRAALRAFRDTLARTQETLRKRY